ncbi:MAG: hydantoinase/oxoprolinase family protein, partial [Rhodobacteraceae bacterium]|nr:hydantoinase/oxoprolinase family protein [Paracoccaceae bacterium]
PESAGADPGPACYGKGGNEPAVTDANVVLGHLPPSLIGGEMSLDVAAAREACKKVAEPLKISIEDAAEGIVRIVNENMFGALRLVSIEQGFDPRDFALVAFGGAGPLHANALGKLSGSWPVIIPPGPGVLCAYGDATTRARNEASQTFVRRYSETSVKEVTKILKDLTKQAQESLIKEGIPAKEQTVVWEVDLRYTGQGFSVPIPCKVEGFEKDGLVRAAKDFDTYHTRQFTFALDTEHEIVNLRAVVLGEYPNVKAIRVGKGGTDPKAAVVDDKHEFWDNGKKYKAKIYDRTKLKAGNVIQGPAIVSEFDSTTVILADCMGTIDNVGCILITPKGKKPKPGMTAPLAKSKPAVAAKPKAKKSAAKPKAKAKKAKKAKGKAKRK